MPKCRRCKVKVRVEKAWPVKDWYVTGRVVGDEFVDVEVEVENTARILVCDSCGRRWYDEPPYNPERLEPGE